MLRAPSACSRRARGPRLKSLKEPPLKIYAGSDHAGVKLKAKLTEHLRQQGLEVVDLGTNGELATDYPDWAARVARAVRDQNGPGPGEGKGESEGQGQGKKDVRGLLVCGSGIGVSIVANKFQGVRAVDAWNVESARMSRSHNDTNVLCLGARLLGEEEARDITDAWLATSFEGGRHLPRIAKVTGIEASEGAEFAARQEAWLLGRRQVVRRVWERDPTVFCPEAHEREPVRKEILNRLGWLSAPTAMEERLQELAAFAQDVRTRGFQSAVLLGMGGSSLCPEVLASTFGPTAGGLRLLVLDNTDPAAVAEVERAIDFDRTLFLVASKSGSTIEVASFENYFWGKALRRGGLDKARAQFCAVTDPATELYHRARDRYHKTFVNPRDIGGRYSALSLFGLVPAVLLGLDIRKLLAAGQAMATACTEEDPLRNPGAWLGAFMAGLGKQGRDKLTLVMSPEVAAFGAWIEQLVAESTGKQGKGIVPVDREPLGSPEVYDQDRVFVFVHLEGGRPAASPEQIQALRSAGHPVLELHLASAYDLGAEFFRWEFATAVAGASLGINPFDEPNVTKAKEATARAIKTFWETGQLPEAGPTLRPDDAEALQRHLASLHPGDYLALCAFFHRTDARDAGLQAIRRACRDHFAVATTLGYGPRFLHSTGQLHKGGPNTGVFLQLVTTATEPDLPVPERGFSFGTLRDAQALGDLEALRSHNRRVVRVQLGRDVEGGLRQLEAALGNKPSPSQLPLTTRPKEA
jgi:glucose-6-phosphate isomerase/ribose 5-phosphate isomerase RpiB